MDNINKEVIIAILLILLAVFVMYPLFESFDATTTEFVPVGDLRHGLRGEPLNTVNIAKYYMRPNRNIVTNNTGGELWESDYAPENERFRGCVKEQCVQPGQDKMDTCWNCFDVKTLKQYSRIEFPNSCTI